MRFTYSGSESTLLDVLNRRPSDGAWRRSVDIVLDCIERTCTNTVVAHGQFYLQAPGEVLISEDLEENVVLTTSSPQVCDMVYERMQRFNEAGIDRLDQKITLSSQDFVRSTPGMFPRSFAAYQDSSFDEDSLTKLRSLELVEEARHYLSFALRSRHPIDNSFGPTVRVEPSMLGPKAAMLEDLLAHCDILDFVSIIDKSPPPGVYDKKPATEIRIAFSKYSVGLVSIPASTISKAQLGELEAWSEFIGERFVRAYGFDKQLVELAVMNTGLYHNQVIPGLSPWPLYDFDDDSQIKEILPGLEFFDQGYLRENPDFFGDNPELARSRALTAMVSVAASTIDRFNFIEPKVYEKKLELETLPRGYRMMCALSDQEIPYHVASLVGSLCGSYTDLSFTPRELSLVIHEHLIGGLGNRAS